LLSLFAETGTGVVVILLWGLLYGAIFGAILGFIAHLFTFGERDFSTSGSPWRPGTRCTACPSTQPGPARCWRRCPPVARDDRLRRPPDTPNHMF
jgi:hypothetical protein